MYYAKAPIIKMQEVNWNLLRLPFPPKDPAKRKEKQDSIIQFREFIRFFQGNYCK